MAGLLVAVAFPHGGWGERQGRGRLLWQALVACQSSGQGRAGERAMEVMVAGTAAGAQNGDITLPVNGAKWCLSCQLAPALRTCCLLCLHLAGLGWAGAKVAGTSPLPSQGWPRGPYLTTLWD